MVDVITITSSKNKKTTEKVVKKNARTSAKKPIADRVLQYAHAPEDTELWKRYGALFGTGRPVDVALASHTDLLKQGCDAALRSYLALADTEPFEMKLHINRIAIRPFADLDFSVVDARKIAANYGKVGYDGSAAVRFCPIPDPQTGAGMMALDLVALIHGNPVPIVYSHRRKRPAVYDDVQRACVSTFLSSDEKALKFAYAQMFTPLLTRLPKPDPFDEESEKFAKGCGPSERAFVTQMCRSQLPVKKMLIGIGAGKSVLDGAIGRMDYLIKAACKGTEEVLHRDLVPHFWFDELRRLELDHLSVPKIKLR